MLEARGERTTSSSTIYTLVHEIPTEMELVLFQPFRSFCAHNIVLKWFLSKLIIFFLPIILIKSKNKYLNTLVATCLHIYKLWTHMYTYTQMYPSGRSVSTDYLKNLFLITSTNPHFQSCYDKLWYSL